MSGNFQCFSQGVATPLWHRVGGCRFWHMFAATNYHIINMFPWNPVYCLNILYMFFVYAVYIYIWIRLYIYVDMIIYYVYAYGISSHQPLYQCVFVLIFFWFSALRRNCVLCLGNNVQVPSKANGWLGQAPLFANSNSDWKKTIPNGNVIFQTLLFRFELLVCRECNICLIGGFKHFLFSLLLGEII